MKLINPKNGVEFTSPFKNHAQAQEALADRLTVDLKDNKFASDIHKKASEGKASEAQLFWLHKLAVEPAKEAIKPDGKIDLSPVVTMLSTAKANGLKFPSLVLRTEDKREIKLHIAGPKSKHEGCVMLSSTTFPGPYYGRITAKGELFSGRDMIPTVRGLLVDLSNDPKSIATHQGKMTGKCCFCRKALDDPKSTALGYGPVCAKKFGLSHNRKAATFAKVPKGGQMEMERDSGLPKPKAKRIIRRKITRA